MKKEMKKPPVGKSHKPMMSESEMNAMMGSMAPKPPKKKKK